MTTRVLGIVLIVLTVLSLGVARATAQDDARKLFEAGKYQTVVEQTAADGSPGAQYVRGLTFLKLNQPDAAKEAFRRVQSGGDAWRSVGESAVALTDKNQDAALEAARKAVSQNGRLAEAQYQLGLVLDAKGDNSAAAEAFAKAADANPQMAYAHYYAGMNFNKAKRVDRMAVYFENFLKLAPNAPERAAVESIMRTVRGK
jgi:tetratricopeptide (TPR) repeat protein